MAGWSVNISGPTEQKWRLVIEPSGNMIFSVDGQDDIDVTKSIKRAMFLPEEINTKLDKLNNG